MFGCPWSTFAASAYLGLCLLDLLFGLVCHCLSSSEPLWVLVLLLPPFATAVQLVVPLLVLLLMLLLVLLADAAGVSCIL